MAEGGGVQAGNEREGAAVREGAILNKYLELLEVQKGKGRRRRGGGRWSLGGGEGKWRGNTRGCR